MEKLASRRKVKHLLFEDEQEGEEPNALNSSESFGEKDLNLAKNLPWLLNFQVGRLFPETSSKPPYSYPELIKLALEEKNEKTVSEIYEWIANHFPFYRDSDGRWKNSIRHNLSINPQFMKGEKAEGRGHLWHLVPNVPKIVQKGKLSPHLINNIRSNVGKSMNKDESDFRCFNSPNELTKSAKNILYGEPSQRVQVQFTANDDNLNASNSLSQVDQDDDMKIQSIAMYSMPTDPMLEPIGYQILQLFPF